MGLAARWMGGLDVIAPQFRFSTYSRAPRHSESIAETFRLRYQVYCLERGFLLAEHYPAELESDEYDAYSTHFGGYALDHTLAGSVRLVEPPVGGAFPWESHCATDAHFMRPDRAQAAEISRLVVRKTYRRRRGDSLAGISSEFMQPRDGGDPARRPAREKRENGPALLLGLYREMYRHSRATGIRYWYAAMERSMARSLEKMGFKFAVIGPQAEYYGTVALYMVDLHTVSAALYRENPLLSAWFHDERIPLGVAARAVWRRWRRAG